MPGRTICYKARWVAKGLEQCEGIDYNETYASVVNKTTTKALLAIAAAKGYCIEQMDVVIAFLYGPITEDVYIEQLTGYAMDGNKVCKLNKGLYGLKQSPLVWYNTITKTLISLGFTRSKFDHSLFMNKQTYLTLYVDDMQIIGPDKAYINTVKQELSYEYKMTDLGPSTTYLGMEITWDLAAKTLTICQRKHIESVLKLHGMENCSSVATPMVSGAILQKAKDQEIPTQELVTAYQSMLGSLMYIMTQSRPDIAFAVSKLSQYVSRPTKTHWEALKQVLRYLSGTKDIGITYGQSGKDSASILTLTGWTDASYNSDINNSKSTGGWLFLLNGPAVSWSSKKQSTVALSTCEAVYMAQAEAAKEAIWLRDILDELGQLQSQLTTIHANNQGALALATTPDFYKRSRHIHPKWHWIREIIAEGTITLFYVKTADMIADGLTKPLSMTSFSRYLKELGLSKGMVDEKDSVQST